MNASDIRFRVYFDQSNGVIKFKDTYTGYGSGDVVKGLVKITGPNGIVYINSGYESDDFSSPDLDDTNDLYNETDFLVNIVDNFDFGLYTFYYKVKLNSNPVISTSRKFDYQVPIPVAETTNSFNRNTSVLTFTDTSSYKINFTYRDYNGTPAPPPNPSPTTGVGGASIPVSKNIIPYSFSKKLVIRPPYSTGQDDATTTSAHYVTFGPNCWTGNYDLFLQSTLYYRIEDWGSSNWVQAIFNVYYESDVDLSVYVSEFERYAPCITAINEKYEQYLSSNPKRAEEYEIVVNKISFYWGLYNIYKNDGRDTSYISEKLLDLLRRYDFCDTTTTTGSVEIFPLGGATSSTPVIEVNSWGSGTEIPEAVYGSDGDFFLVTTSSRVYKKINGTWSFLMTISGSGSLRDSVVITSDYTITNADEFVVVEASSSDVILTLDEIANFDDEKEIKIKAKDKTYSITIESANGETIETRNFYSIMSEGDTIDIRPVGTNWEIV